MKILPRRLENCSVALVYDRVNTPHGGAEKVLLALHALFPNAPLYTSVYNSKTASWANVFDVRPSWLSRLPFAHHHRLLLPLMPLAFESFDLSAYDLIISITSAEAKGIITQPHQLHLSYLLTPTRYLYSHQHEYLTTDSHLSAPGTKWLAHQLLKYIKWWDQAAAARPDVIIPISELVAKRTRHYYNRSTVSPIYPPLETLPLTTQRPTLLPPTFDQYLLIVSRLVSYKRLDVATLKTTGYCR
jgi:glycosyltransferase involved in cell wall biosynthesis